MIAIIEAHALSIEYCGVLALGRTEDRVSFALIRQVGEECISLLPTLAFGEVVKLIVAISPVSIFLVCIAAFLIAAKDKILRSVGALVNIELLAEPGLGVFSRFQDRILEAPLACQDFERSRIVNFIPRKLVLLTASHGHAVDALTRQVFSMVHCLRLSEAI